MESTEWRVSAHLHSNTSAIRERALPALCLLGVATILLGFPVARAQSLPPYDIKPTVTARTGDPGGKYFGQTPDPAKVRHYYIAAESDQWDYLPSGADPVCGMIPTAEVLSKHRVRKVRYFQYTDATFTKRVPETPRLGIMGPVLRGVVGDYLEITFLNRAPLPLSMHPHGAKYDKDSEGSYYGNRANSPAAGTRVERSTPGLGAAVGPDAKFTYVWYLDEQSGPLPSEPSSKAWLYHSHVGGEGEINLGLVGFIIVTDPKRARPDGTPNDVDREMPALFMIFNESSGDPEAAEHAAAAAAATGNQKLDPLLPGFTVSPGKSPPPVNPANPDEGERYALNGLIYGNLNGLEMNEGERVRWYLFGLGSETDLHTAHWHGLRVIEENTRRTDVVELLPASMKVADMVADDPGDWLFHCHVSEHMANGMFALVTVHPKGKPGASTLPAKAFLGFPPPAPANPPAK